VVTAVLVVTTTMVVTVVEVATVVLKSVPCLLWHTNNSGNNGIIGSSGNNDKKRSIPALANWQRSSVPGPKGQRRYRT